MQLQKYHSPQVHITIKEPEGGICSYNRKLGLKAGRVVRRIYRPPAVYALSGNGLSGDQQTFHIQLCGSSISPS